MDDEKIKFGFGLTGAQVRAFDKLRDALAAVSRAEVVRKSLALAEVYADAVDRGLRVCLVDDSGKVVETLKFI